MTIEEAVKSDSAPEEDVNVESSPIEDVNTESSTEGEQAENEATDKVEETVEEAKIPQSRLNKEIYKRQNAEKALSEMNARLDALENTPKEIVEPTLESFDYDEDEYNTANVDYRVQQGIEEYKQTLAIEQQKSAQKSRYDTFNEAGLKYNETNPDYQTAVENFGNVAINQSVIDAIIASDNAPALHHALLNDLDLLSKLGNMDVGSLNRYLGRNEDSLVKGIKKKIPTKKLTNAPDPIDIDIGGSRPKTEPTNADLVKMTGGQYAKYMAGRV